MTLRESNALHASDVQPPRVKILKLHALFRIGTQRIIITSSLFTIANPDVVVKSPLNHFQSSLRHHNYSSTPYLFGVV